MYISKICFKNFRCFGPEETTLYLEPDLTFFVGNNGTGKSTVFYALKKIFGSSNEERIITKEDFYLNQNEKIDNIENREMYIDVTFDFPELSENSLELNTVSAFEHSIYADKDKTFHARIRLESKWSNSEFDDDVETKLYWIKTSESVTFGDDYEVKTTVAPQERKFIELRYIPAFRHSNAILKNNISKLIKIIIDYAKIDEEKGKIDCNKSKIQEIEEINHQLQDEIKDIKALKQIKEIIDKNWGVAQDQNLKYYAKTQFDVTPSDLNELLSSICLKLVPSENGNTCDIDKLSDGQISLLYITLSLTIFEIEQKHYKNEIVGLKQYDKIPAIFTIFAIEEPENHLSPFYLSKIFQLLNKTISNNNNIIGLFSTHSPCVMKRLKRISQVRYFRQEIMNFERYTLINKLELPQNDVSEDYKYINQAILNHPEMYFAKLVILGEGDSEEIIISNIASKLNVDLDPQFVSFVKLGGRHVNHMWRLLNALNIPNITLLDFDLGRKHGGISKFKYILQQLQKIDRPFCLPEGISEDNIISETLSLKQALKIKHELEKFNVFFSFPLDIDMLILHNYKDIYKLETEEAVDRTTLEKNVLKTHGSYEKYTDWNLNITNLELQKYSYFFKNRSKVASHYIAIEDILKISDNNFKQKAPKVINRLINKANNILKGEI